MAIITSGDIKIKDTITAPTWPYNCEIDLNTKSINKLSNFPIVMKGDNNSVTIVIKTPLEYQGVDLSGTNCVLSYNTTWTNQEGTPSSGQIDLGEPIGYNENDEKVENVLDDTVKYLTYGWTLDVRQTAEIGDCNFNIAFLMNLDGDPFIDNVNIFLSEKEDGASSFIDFESTELVERQLRYWSVSTENCIVPIGDPKTIIENNYNLALPNDLQSSVKFIEQKAAETKADADRAESQANEAFGYSLDAANAVLGIEASAASAASAATSAAVSAASAEISKTMANVSAESAKASEDQIREYKEAIVDNLQGQLYDKNEELNGNVHGWYWERYYDGKAVCYGSQYLNFVKKPDYSDDIIATYQTDTGTSNNLNYMPNIFDKITCVTANVVGNYLLDSNPSQNRILLGANYLNCYPKTINGTNKILPIFLLHLYNMKDKNLLYDETEYFAVNIRIEGTWNVEEAMSNEN